MGCPHTSACKLALRQREEDHVQRQALVSCAAHTPSNPEHPAKSCNPVLARKRTRAHHVRIKRLEVALPRSTHITGMQAFQSYMPTDSRKAPAAAPTLIC